jgi:hypothetical protein
MGQRIHRQRISMTAAAYVDRAREWERKLVDREAARTGLPVNAARKAVSQRLAMPQGTLENLRRNRLKAIAAHWYDALRAAVIADLQAELRHVQHDLQIAHQTGLDPRTGAFFSLAESEARLKAALGLTDPPIEGGE